MKTETIDLTKFEDRLLQVAREARVPVAVSLMTGEVFEPSLIKFVNRFSITITHAGNDYFVPKHAIKIVGPAKEVTP
jgi:sRNA-binding regulator protein Hfq